ncbi:hypothetical protein Vafri_2544 [Volvox africanus]|uniref:Uncharacterized protein n=1 Tax=Volvox africanus TaxID=51714 RepID=A0A8J4API4_9CHLO|nr:hypothetical protein Vafri_2544 [Volvox africanus]
MEALSAALQLSEMQRAFVQFCGVLQELILNHQVAHSVVQSLHNDLPALQPEPKGPSRNATPSSFRTGAAVDDATSRRQSSSSSFSSLEHLQHLAPRLTPTAAASAVAFGNVGTDPSYRVASECQDNYVILQNAALRSRDLLSRLQQLHRSALATLEQQSLMLADGRASGSCDSGAPYPDPTPDPDRNPDWYSEVECSYSGLPTATDGTVFSGYDVDAETYQPVVGTTADGGAAATTDAVSTPGPSSLGMPQLPPNTSGRGPANPAAAASAAAVMTTTSQRPSPSDAVQRLPGSDLVIIMGELCREVSLEVELLVCIASSMELQTPPEDLAVYDIMLKLQPYTDERIVAVALAQRDLLLPIRSAEGRGEGPSAGQHGKGGGGVSRSRGRTAGA